MSSGSCIHKREMSSGNCIHRQMMTCASVLFWASVVNDIVMILAPDGNVNEKLNILYKYSLLRFRQG